MRVWVLEALYPGDDVATLFGIFASEAAGRKSLDGVGDWQISGAGEDTQFSMTTQYAQYELYWYDVIE